jgi:hypothetical protein
MSSSLDVVNEGLVRLGVPPLASLSDQGAQALAADSIYATTREAALAEHPWSFAYREVTLPKLALSLEAKRNTSFEYAYQLPPDSLRVLGLRSLDTFRLAGDQLYTNDKEARLVYIADVPESQWPAYFRKQVSFQFAAAAAITLTENTTRAELMYNLAADQRRTARSVDSMQTPPYVFNLMRVYLRRTSNPLAQA